MRIQLTRLRTAALIASAVSVGGGSAVYAARTDSVSPAVSTTPIVVENTSAATSAFALKGVVTNSSSGVGVAGYGISLSRKEYGVYGTTSGPTGVGVYGLSQYAEPAGGPTSANETTGVYGSANNGYGLEGTTGVQHSQTSGLFSGILGIDSTSNFGNNNGVLGITTNGYFGVEGLGGSGAVGGVYGSGDNASYGVFGSSTGVGVEGSSGSTPLAASNASGSVVWSVNANGTVTTTAAPQTIGAARDGAIARSFVPSSTTPLLEDVGSATLVRGASVVRLDPAFGSSIASAVYQVFITPSGESNGLYVAQKTASQFVVRENAGGHSTIGFDYRIVAKPFADDGRRIALGRSAREFGMPAQQALPLGTRRHGFPSPINTTFVQTLVQPKLK